MLGLISVLYYVTFLIITLIMFVFFCVAFVIVKPFDSQGALLHWASRLWTKLFFMFGPGWKMKVEGLENLQTVEPYVVVVNHQSMVDVPLMYVLPFNFKWVAKKEVYKIPIFGWVMGMHGDIAIDRGSSKAGQKLMSQGHRWLKDGTSVIMFPEGTRSKNGDLGRFKEGAFLLAKSSHVAVLPCVLDGTLSLVTEGWKIRCGHTFSVRVLPPITKETVDQLSAKELAVLAQQRMIEAHSEIRNRNV